MSAHPLSRRLAPRFWVAVALGLALGLALALALDRSARPANAQAGAVQVTPTQLLINQRISQAGVRRSNEALQLLGPIRGSGAEGFDTEQIADGAITSAKLAEGVGAGAGPAGPAGPPGADGAPGSMGATGPRGPSDVFIARNNTLLVLTGADQVILSDPVPGGTYLVTARVELDNTGANARFPNCSLRRQPGAIVFDLVNQELGPDPEADREVVTLHGVIEVPAPSGTIQTLCDRSGVANDQQVRNIVQTALAVETVTGP